MVQNSASFTLINTTQTTLTASQLIQYLHRNKICSNYIYAPKFGSKLYSLKELKLMEKDIKSSEIIGISSFSISEARAFQLIRHIKKKYPDKHVIIGGPNAIMDPIRVLTESKADSVCVYEGEIPLMNLIMHKDKKDIKGIWFNDRKKIIKNEYQKPLQSLDDMGFENYKNSKYGYYKKLTSKGFVSEKTMGEKINNPCMQGNFLYMMTIRGCLFNCSYCINHRLNELNHKTGSKILRKKSSDTIIKDLKEILKNESEIEKVFFFDDDFFVRTELELKEFADKYKREIGLPFLVFANPLSMTEKKIDFAVEAGIDSIEFGLQTTSIDTLKIYNRSSGERKIKEILDYVSKKEYKINISIDFITNSPFESKEDVIKNINYILALPGDFMIYVHNLHLFPGSKLRECYELGTGNETSEYQDQNNVLNNKMFNEYETKILMAMQGWHRSNAPDLFGVLTKQEIAYLIGTKKYKIKENMKELNKKITQTISAKYYVGLESADKITPPEEEPCE